MISRIIRAAFKNIPLFKTIPLMSTFKIQCLSSTKNKQQSARHAYQDGQKSEEDIFMNDEQQISRWSDNYKDIVANYPFQRIPMSIIRNPQNYDIPPEYKYDIIAFKVLTIKNELPLSASILLPNQTNPNKYQSAEDGRQLFSQYYQDKYPKLIDSLNLGEGTLDQRIVIMQILNNISTSKLSKEDIKRIDIRALDKQDQTGILISHCIKLFIRYNLEYTHLLQRVLEKLEESSPVATKLKIAKAIISTPFYMDYYSRKIIDTAISAIISSIPVMHNYQIIYILRFIYNYNSEQAKLFARSLQKHLVLKYVEDKNINFHIPLVLKTIKFCSKQGVSTKELLEFVSTNMKRFQVIFDKRRGSKGLFFSLLFNKNNKQISPQLIGHLKHYFLNGLAEFTQSEETQQNQLIRFNKLLINYFQHFSEKEQEYIKSQYIERLIPYYSKSNQVLFYSILIYLRIKSPEESSIDQAKQDVLKRYIIQFFQKSCSKSNNQELLVVNHINSVIQMMYQILRHNITLSKNQMPLICRYDFQQKQTINPENLNGFFYYLLKTKHQNKQQVRNALTSASRIIQVYIRKHKIKSLKTVFSILDVCDKVSFQHNFFYKILENTIAEYLINNPNFVIIEKDLKFINEKFIKRGYGSPKLKSLILGTLQKPKNWQKLRFQYTERQREYLQSINRKRREKRYNSNNS